MVHWEGHVEKRRWTVPKLIVMMGGREGRKLLKGPEQREYRVELQETGRRRAVQEKWTRRGSRG